MKANTRKHAAPMASFIEGMNSTLAHGQARLNGIGLTARTLKQLSAMALIVLIVPMGTGDLFAQSTYTPQSQQYQGAPPPPPQGGTNSDQGAPPPPQDQGEPQQQYQGAPPPPPEGQEYSDQGAPPPYPGAPQGQPLDPQQLDQMVAPIALYPDALVAQVLAASTYPSEVVEADRWLQAQGNMPPDQIAAAANAQNWDPSVKALVAFPSVLAQMDKNIQWTTDLGNAYYNQPQDVMAAVQTMRSRAQAAGTLRSTPQQVVSDEDGDIVIAPANPEVVYVPMYNPWVVYGAPFGVFPGYYYGPSAGVYFGNGLAIGFGVGIGIGFYSRWGWGYHHWRPDWRNRTVIYNHNTYITRSRTVYNRGFNRPGGPHGYAGGRGVYNRGGAYNRGAYNRGGAVNRGGSYNRGGAYNNRGGAYNNRGGAYNNRGGAYNRGGSYNRGAYNRGGAANRSTGPTNNQGRAQPRGGEARGGGHSGGGAPRMGGGAAPRSGGGGGGGHEGGHGGGRH